MSVRKCHEGEIEKILEVANGSFIPDRDENFTFVNSVSYIYNNPNYDYSDSHFVVEENDKMIALGANLINELNIDGNNYKMSRVGTIGTLPEYRNRGYMRQVMNSIEEENINNDVVFSLLYGKRERYRHYGYEKACLFANYIFFKDQVKYFNNEYNVCIREYKETDLDEIYSIYLDNKTLRNAIKIGNTETDYSRYRPYNRLQWRTKSE